MLALLALLPLIPTAVLLRERMVLLERDRTEAEAAVRQVYQSALVRSIDQLGEQAAQQEDPQTFLIRQLHQIFGDAPRIEFMSELGGSQSDETVSVRIDAPPLHGWVKISEFAGKNLPGSQRSDRVEIWRLPVILFLATLTMAAACGWVLLRRLRLEDLRSDLLSIFSHEIRTPLAGLRVITDTLETLPDDEIEKRRDYYELLRQENSRLMRFVDNFLTVNRLERGGLPTAKRPFHLSEIVREGAEVMRPLVAESGSKIEVELPSEPESEIIGNPDALTTVLTNLIDNAVKHSPDPVTIRITANVGDELALLTVEDSGPGIPPEERKSVLRRFYQIDQRLSRRVDGCGLGLHICRSLVQAHGGKLEIGESHLGGAKITVNLPR